jgi:hypothetical protein
MPSVGGVDEVEKKESHDLVVNQILQFPNQSLYWQQYQGFLF